MAFLLIRLYNQYISPYIFHDSYEIKDDSQLLYTNSDMKYNADQ